MPAMEKIPYKMYLVRRRDEMRNVGSGRVRGHGQNSADSG
jgi:hypothetical protein